MIADGQKTHEAELTIGKVKKDLLFDNNGRSKKRFMNKHSENEKEEDYLN